MTAQLFIFLHKCSLFRGLKMRAFLFTVLASALIVSSSMSDRPKVYNPCPQYCEECSHRTVEECGDRGRDEGACACCFQCAKLEGETCYGAYGLPAGVCRKDLKCTVPLQYVEDGTNLTGTCKLPRTEFESCGGAYGHLGRCHDNFTCGVPHHAVDYDKLYINGADIRGICVEAKTCLRDCNTKKTNRKCGPDGRWYRNLCEFRKKKCFLSEEERQNFKVQRNHTICDTACPDLEGPDPVPVIPDHTQFVLSNGIRDGSVATFSCDTGYVRSSGSTTLTCRSREWQGTPPTCHSDPCHNVRCGRGRRCIATSDSNHDCVCKSQSECRLEPEPVCGSDGRTYSSQCHLDAQYCQSGSLIYTVHSGVCEGSTVPPSTEAGDADFLPK